MSAFHAKNHPIIRVYLVENNPLAARELRRILRRVPGVQFVRTHETSIYPLTFDLPVVFIIDRSTLADPWKSYAAQLRSHAPQCAILVLDASFSQNNMVELLAAGADGCLSFEEVLSKLAPAVRALAQGRMWTPVQTLEECVRQLNHLHSSAGVRGKCLTAREREVLGLVQKKLSNHRIGQELGISEGTVKFHLANMFAKLGVKDRFAAVNAASLAIEGHEPAQRY